MYLRNTRYINNWDLVDLSSHHIVGDFLLDKPRQILYDMAGSSLIWDRRISIVSTARFIKNGYFDDTLKISALLLGDKEDLIHKAAGWMLREVGKKNLPVLEGFLKKHYMKMPRTMLRYAIERFPEKRRQEYLKGKV
jgi:3-methyladenine DNA glycosylase AlkD